MRSAEMGAMPRLALQGTALAGAGAAGAAIAVGVVAAAGGVGSTTVREVVSAVQEPDAASFAAPPRPRTIHEVYERAAPGVVQVTGARALGSGFVIDKAGHILTNEHVVRGLQHVYVSFSNNKR